MGRVSIKVFQELAESVEFRTRKNKIELENFSDLLEAIGKGRSACVFKIKGESIALKVFFPHKKGVAKEEAAIYRKLQGISYYPHLFEEGLNYIAMDYIEGHTLFQCLQRGIVVTGEEIKEVDKALVEAKQGGLNPSDIHLKNIILTPERKIKIIDVARFRQKGQDRQWNDLRKFYEYLYNKRFFPKRLPAAILNTVSFIYKKRYLPQRFGENSPL